MPLFAHENENQKRSETALPPMSAIFPDTIMLHSDHLANEIEWQVYAKMQERVNRGLRTFIDEMSLVFRFIETISTIHSLPRITKLLLGILKELCGQDAAALYLTAEGETETADQLWAYENLPMVEILQRELAIDDRIYNWVFQQGHAVIIPDRFRKQPPLAEQEQSFMIAPLLHDTKRLGRIEMVFKRPQGSFTQQTFSVLNVLLKHAMMVIANERLYDKERKAVQKYVELDLLKKDIVNITTHEIKTPLTIIQAASVLARHRRIPALERKMLLIKIADQCEKINLIISELFETSKLDNQQVMLRPQVFSLRDLTEEVARDYRESSRRIIIEGGQDKNSVVWADRLGITKAVRNLVENAMKYSPSGGKIIIRIRMQGDKVCWSITDQGAGIPEKEQALIFEKFYRGGGSTTRRVGGMGLGLYIVKSNIMLNQGKIELQSTAGQGATFIFELPRAPQKMKNAPDKA